MKTVDKAKRNANARRWRSLNKEKVKNTNLKILYNITLDQYNQMVKSQNGLCAICKFKEPLVVDHCHQTNQIRGLLCHKCNKGIGLLKENMDVILNAFSYIKKWKTIK